MILRHAARRTKPTQSVAACRRPHRASPDNQRSFGGRRRPPPTVGWRPRVTGGRGPTVVQPGRQARRRRRSSTSIPPASTSTIAARNPGTGEEPVDARAAPEPPSSARTSEYTLALGDGDGAVRATGVTGAEGVGVGAGT